LGLEKTIPFQGFGVRVLSNIAEKAIALVDHAAGSWLARMGKKRETHGREVAMLRRLAFLCVAMLVVIPTTLSTVISPAVALPGGVGLVLASFLIMAVAGLALPRDRSQTTAANNGSIDDTLLDACAGLVLFLDPHGAVTTVAGRDRLTFLSYMRSPLGHGFAEQVHVSDRIRFIQAIDTLRQGDDAVTVDLRLERPAMMADGGQFVHIRMDMTALRQSNGALSRIFSQLRDVSHEQALKVEANRKAEEAETANEAKTRFLAAVSHELRTPLNAILGFSDILIGEYFGKLQNDRQREYVTLIRQSGGHLLSVVNTMLDMSKIETGRYELMMEAFEIAESVKACEAMLGLQAREKGVTLTSRIQRDLGEVVADQRAVQQVLINLVGNAIKFTDIGGAVSMDAALDGNVLKLCVSDTGIGIADDKIGMLGQPFVQIQSDYSRGYEGTGLGLSLVKGLVALHGGTFSIASRVGEGTVVTVTIPLDGSGAASVADAAEQDKTVEFPPRLKSVSGGLAGLKQEDVVHDQAKAKIA
jgi:cell cycle sensor histidine kinase DivJ